MPFGWFAVAFSRDVPRGSVKAARCAEQDLVVFRTDDGRIAVLAAYCPHLGSHLARGEVEGERLRCPFHRWEFDGSGECKAIPFVSVLPKRARVRSYPCVELHGLVFAWVAPDAALAPTYTLRAAQALSSDAWAGPARRHGPLRTCIQEIKENLVDRMHFMTVHTTSLTSRFLELPKLARFEEHGASLQIESHTTIRLLGVASKTVARFEVQGPGLDIAHIDGAVPLYLVFADTPIDRHTSEMRLLIFTRRYQVPGLTRAVLAAAARRVWREVQEDEAMWANKKYEPDPVLCSADGPIPRYRRWMQQFYPAATA